MWSRFVRSPIFPGLLAAAVLSRLLFQSLSWIGVAALIIVLIWFGIALTHWLVIRRERRMESPGGDDSPASLISLIFLLDEPRHPTEEDVRTCVATALDLDTGDSAAGELVFSADPAGSGTGFLQFIVKIPDGVFGVIISPNPYVDNPRQYARQTIQDKRLRTAVENHRAWVSVDLMSDVPVDSEEKKRIYAVIGKILGSMAGPDCLAVYCPELQRCNEFDPLLIEKLSDGDPLPLFRSPTFEPVIEISENDPLMKAAVDEARQRWPEFVRAFKNRADPEDERYITKAEFVENEISEFMWVSVNRIENEGESIRGILMNDPYELLEIHRGQEVSVSFDRLNDWLFPSETGEAVGGFTLKILAEDSDESDE